MPINRGNLDTLFLTVVGLFSFSFLRGTANNSIPHLINALGILAVLFAFPIVTGYVMGAIVENAYSDTFRAIGWISLVVAAFTCGAWYIAQVPGGLLVGQVVAASGFPAAMYVGRLITSALQIRLDLPRRLALAGSAISAFIFPFIALLIPS